MTYLLLDDAVELLKEFGIQYLKSFGIAMFEKIKADVEGGDDNGGLKLTYRDVSCFWFLVSKK